MKMLPRSRTCLMNVCGACVYACEIQRNNDVLAERQVFYDMGKVKTGRHGLCYVGHQFISGDMEEELLIYHILLQLQGIGPN